MKFILLTLLVCTTIIPTDGLRKGFETVTCAVSYPEYYVRADQIVRFTPQFTRNELANGEWSQPIEACMILASGQSIWFPVEETCQQVLDGLED